MNSDPTTDKTETPRERKNRLARERRIKRAKYNKGSKADRLEAYAPYGGDW